MTNFSTAANDRVTILKHLQNEGALTTLKGRKMGIMSPAARVLELRKRGYKIITHWTTTIDGAGRKHRQAKYVLFAGGDVKQC